MEEQGPGEGGEHVRGIKCWRIWKNLAERETVGRRKESMHKADRPFVFAFDLWDDVDQYQVS